MTVESKFVPPVVDTLRNVFSMMMQIEPEMGEASIKDGDTARGEVTGILKMEGDTAKGSIAITFTTPVVIDIVKRMLQMDITEIDEIARDMAGEMANIVVGGAKNLLEEQGYKIDMSLPEVFEGEEHHIKHYFEGETIEIPFSLDSGDFFIEVNFTEAA